MKTEVRILMLLVSMVTFMYVEMCKNGLNNPQAEETMTTLKNVVDEYLGL